MKRAKKALGAMPQMRFPEYRGADGWSSEKLGDHLDYIQPTPYLVSSTNYDDRYQTPVLTAGKTFILGYTDEADGVFHKNLPVIIFDDFTTATKFVDFPFKAKSSAMKILSPKGDASLRFFYELMQVLEYDVGAHERHWISIFAKLDVPIPSVDEQNKIADCLVSFDACFGAETRKLHALKAHKQGLMQQLFPTEGQHLPRLRFPGFEGEWQNKPLSKVCNVLQGYGFPEVLQGKTGGKYPFCKVSDISRAVAGNGGLLATAINYVDDEELSQLRAKPIPKGATVFAKIGEALRLNRRAFVQKECLIDNNVVGLKAVQGIADDYFVFLLSQLIDLNEHCGGAVPSVNKTTLEAIDVVVPKPDEQERIAALLSSLDDLIATQTRKIATLQRHKKGLMQGLFPAMDAHAA